MIRIQFGKDDHRHEACPDCVQMAYSALYDEFTTKLIAEFDNSEELKAHDSARWVALFRAQTVFGAVLRDARQIIEKRRSHGWPV